MLSQLSNPVVNLCDIIRTVAFPVGKCTPATITHFHSVCVCPVADFPYRLYYSNNADLEGVCRKGKKCSMVLQLAVPYGQLLTPVKLHCIKS